MQNKYEAFAFGMIVGGAGGAITTALIWLHFGVCMVTK